MPADPQQLVSILPAYLDLDVEVVARALAWLQEHGLLVSAGQGRLRSERTAYARGSSADGAREVHVRALEQAQRTIGSVPHEHRELGVLTLAVPVGEVDALKAELWTFLQRARPHGR